jgi:hydantoinase/carbamoylase family amidase
VPNGGRFDGALGVVAAIEALERIGPQARPLAAVVFRDEERGCAGSRARGARGPLPASFVEVHIEQGPRLAAAEAPLGVVTAIVGYTRRKVVFEGRTGHAGTTPMDGREDALCRAADYVLRVREAAAAIDGAVGTVGRLEVEPGAENVIPGRVTVTVDVRAPDADRLGELLASLDLEPGPITAPAAMSATIKAALGEELEQRGLPAVELASGHDAGILATAGVASGMLFVRSLAGGVSHSPDELSSAEDIELAIDVLRSVLLRLAS